METAGDTLHVIMKMFTILLCVFANRVTSHAHDFVSAKILAQQKTISENSVLFVTCSTFGLKRNSTVYIYLCKNDYVVDSKTQKQDQNDTVFIINRVGLHHSGNYTCVFSKNLKIKKAKSTLNMLQILVIANFLPADISVAGPSAVSEGDSVELRCTVSDILQTLGACQFIQSYLMKNESILQVQAFNVTQKEAAFTIGSAVERDSGHYSCVVLPSKCFQETTLHGNNAVLVEVKVRWVLRVILFGGGTILLLSLSLCMYQRGFSIPFKPCASKQEKSVMFKEQQVHTEGEEMEAQDASEDSFSMGEEYDDISRVDAEDPVPYGDNDEDPYSVADLPEQQDPAYLYAISFRQNKTAH